MDDELPTSQSGSVILANIGQYSENFLLFVKEIRKDLKESGIDVAHQFIINIVKLAALEPNNKFLMKQALVPSELDRLKKIVTERIIGMSEISRCIIRLQLHIRNSWMSRGKVISQFREGIDSKVVPLLAEMRKSVPKHLAHNDLYYEKLIGATIYYSNMGPDTEHSVVHETREVIEHIFNKEDIQLLETMSPKDREIELMNIISIAVGVRLFMKEHNPSGYGEFFENLPKILPRKLKDGLLHLRGMKSLNVDRLIKYTTAIHKYFLKHFVIRAGRREVSLGMVKARQGLVMVHQLLFYVKNIMEELINEDKHVEQLFSRYHTVMMDLERDIEKKNVPSKVTNPKYVELCECWQNLMDSNVFVNTLLQLSLELVYISEKELLPMDDFINEFISALNLKVPSEQEFFYFPHVKVDLDLNTHGLKKIEYRGDVDPSNMNFSGFCVNSLVRGAGLPVMANPNMGIFTWKNMNFMFATAEAAREFSRNPGVVVRRAIAIARRWPELIILLNLEAEAYDYNSSNEADGYKRFFSGLLVSKSSGTQCEMHPTPSNIVESYTWNEWELRRRGIILSKIHKRRTHSTQTHWQALKKTTACQTYAQTSKEVQTNTNVHTAVPTTKFYFAGLRGYHCGTSPHIVEMTTETPEDLHCVCMPKVIEEVGLVTEHSKHGKVRKSIVID